MACRIDHQAREGPVWGQSLLLRAHDDATREDVRETNGGIAEPKLTTNVREQARLMKKQLLLPNYLRWQVYCPSLRVKK